MTEAQALEEKVRPYVEWAPNNDKYLNFHYLDELGMKYGYDVVCKEIRRQRKEKN